MSTTTKNFPTCIEVAKAYLRHPELNLIPFDIISMTAEDLIAYSCPVQLDLDPEGELGGRCSNEEDFTCDICWNSKVKVIPQPYLDIMVLERKGTQDE